MLFCSYVGLISPSNHKHYQWPCPNEDHPYPDQVFQLRIFLWYNAFHFYLNTQLMKRRHRALMAPNVLVLRWVFTVVYCPQSVKIDCKFFVDFIIDFHNSELSVFSKYTYNSYYLWYPKCANILSASIPVWQFIGCSAFKLLT